MQQHSGSFYNKTKPLLLDGSMGSYLQSRHDIPENPLWSSLYNFTRPDIVRNLHREYMEAGADIITTNTFRTNPAVLAHSSIGISVERAVSESVLLAKEAASSTSILIAGSNPPAEDCYQIPRTISKTELANNHYRHINALIDAGVHFILHETQSHFDEIAIICEYCHNNKIPYVISLFITDSMTILSGENISDVLTYISFYNPLAVSFNCIKPDLFHLLAEKIQLPDQWGVYLNCGSGNYTDSNITCGIDPKAYAVIIKNYLSFNPVFAGGCCGTTPDHIKELRTLLDETDNY